MIKNPANWHLYQHCVIVAISVMLSANTSACSGLLFSDAWIREPPPVARVAAAYSTITNETDQDLTINEVASDCCAHIMVHETAVENGKTKMKHISKLVIPAGETVKLEPLGKHLMLIKPQHTLSDGDNVVMKFVCGSGQSSDIVMSVMKQ